LTFCLFCVKTKEIKQKKIPYKTLKTLIKMINPNNDTQTDFYDLFKPATIRVEKVSCLMSFKNQQKLIKRKQKVQPIKTKNSK
jgi:hypothetical protein